MRNQNKTSYEKKNLLLILKRYIKRKKRTKMDTGCVVFCIEAKLHEKEASTLSAAIRWRFQYNIFMLIILQVR